MLRRVAEHPWSPGEAAELVDDFVEEGNYSAGGCFVFVRDALCFWESRTRLKRPTNIEVGDERSNGSSGCGGEGR